MRIRRVFAAIAAAFIFAAPAQAQFGGGGYLAKRIAQERFPEHCAPWSVGYRDLGPYLGYVRAGTCRIWLDDDFASRPWPERCTIFTHEMGHLAGYPTGNWPHIMRRFPPIHKPCLRRPHGR